MYLDSAQKDLLNIQIKVETGESWFEASSGKKKKKLDTISKNKLGIVVYACNPSYTESIGRKISLRCD
jgi:hypothetical protein